MSKHDPTSIQQSREHTERQFLTTVEVGKLIGRSPGAIRNLVLRRQIPFRKPGGRLLFLRHEILSWIEFSPGLRLDDLR